MIKSMTAFARSEGADGSQSVAVEVRSYNSRYLDLVLRLPAAFASMEDKIKGLVTAAVARGRIELRLQTVALTAEAVAFTVDAPRAVAHYRALNELRELLRIEEPVALAQVLAPGEVIRPAEPPSDAATVWPLIEDGIRRALSELDKMRRREGEVIATDIARRIDTVARNLTQIEKQARGLLEKYRDRLRERIAALTDGIVAIDADRLTQEAAILADRSDITEEIVRATSHLAQFRVIMHGDEPAGRKLNFLMQELNREFNTIGSKSDSAAIAHLVVDVKAELEKIREQLQNVE
jgi:uncharacterized protein (TIGR00255 family)